MVIREFFKERSDGVKLFRSYSDEGFYLVQNETGIEYPEAVDVEDAVFTYSESDKVIEEENGNEATAADYEAALERFGVK